MKLIIKYFKPFVFMAAISLTLLFAQDIASLFLPRYMSDMVDTGLIRGGITERTPRAMSNKAFDIVTSFMSDAGKAVFEEAYTPVTGRGDLKRADSRDFPLLGEGVSGWVLTETDDTRIETLGKHYGNATYMMMGIVMAQLGGGPDAPQLDIASSLEPQVLYGVMEDYSILMASLALSDIATAAPPRTEDGAEEMKIPDQMRYEIGTSFTRLFYRELGANLGSLQQGSILQIGLIMLGITLGVALITVGNSFLSSRISTGIGRNMRRDVFAKIQTYSPAEFDKFSTASLITRNTNDVQQLQMVAMMSLRMILSAPITGIGGAVMALSMNVDMSWIIILSIVLLVTLQIIIILQVVPRFQIMQKLLDKLNLVARESLSGMMVIRAFGNEKREEERFDKANDDMRRTNRFVERMMAIQNPTMQFLLGCTTLTILFFGTRAVDMGNMQVGQMMAFMQYVMQVIQAFLMISMMFIMIPRALVSAKRVAEVLNTDTAIADKPKDQLRTIGGRARGEIVFKNVYFQYQDAEMPVLEDISFTARAGETTAFIGSTGSGKSTLINLIPRFYDVTKGSITLDGIDLRDMSLHELRENLGYVPQKGLLFSGNIGTNLSYGKEDATEEDFREAIKTAQAEGFVYADKDGLETEIAQSGDNVSGGQKQRLSIARALVKNPPIYIFDDSFSALDFRTDAALRRALRENTVNTTTLVVAQRVSTIMNANQIVVLDTGKIVGIGTHRELLKTCEQYREIAESQLSKEELA